jgi:cytochrome c553
MLSYVFALRQNRPPATSTITQSTTASLPPPPATLPAATPLQNSGIRIFETQKCQTCHSINGIGNPRYPLDGVASRLTDTELRDWITGTGTAEANLPSSIRRRKKAYLNISATDMQMLIEHLSTLKSQPLLPNQPADNVKNPAPAPSKQFPTNQQQKTEKQ